MWRKVLLLILVTFSFGCISIQLALGAEYPTRPIELLSMVTPGSGQDLVSRLIAETAPRYLGQPMVVVNKPGAGGSIVASDVISSKADGYKLVQLTNFFFATTIKTFKILFDPSFLTPIASIYEFKVGMMVKGDSPWKSFNDLLDYAKKNPGKLRWAHLGRGQLQHMTGMLLFRKGGASTIDIPYKGTPEAIASLLGGHIDAYSGPYEAVKDHVTAGSVRYLVFYASQRYSEPSNVPCATELGFPEVGKLKALTVICTHKDCSEQVKKTLIDAFKKICEDPEFRRQMETMGSEMRYGGPEFVMKAIKEAEEVGVPIIKELGLYVEQK